MTDSLSEKLKKILGTIECKDISGIDMNEYDDKSGHSGYHRYINGYIEKKSNENTDEKKRNEIAKHITFFTNDYLKIMLRGKETDKYIKYLPLTFVFEIFKYHPGLRDPILAELQKSTSVFSNKLLIELYNAIMNIEKCDKAAFQNKIDAYEAEKLKKEQEENLKKNEKNESLLLILNNDELTVNEKLKQLLTTEKPKFIVWMLNSTYNNDNVKTLFGNMFYERITRTTISDTIDDIKESISGDIDAILEGNDDDKKNKLLALIREMLTPPPIGGSNRKKKRTKKYKKKRSRKMQTRRKMHRKPSSIRRKN